MRTLFLGSLWYDSFRVNGKEHLYFPSGKPKGIKSGTPQATAIATSILAYKNPAPPQQLSERKCYSNCKRSNQV